MISYKTSSRSEKGNGGIAQCQGGVCVLCTLKNSIENVSLNCHCKDCTEKDALTLLSVHSRAKGLLPEDKMLKYM